MKTTSVDDVHILIAARMASTRLPGKAAYKFGNQTVLGFLIERLAVVFMRSRIIVCTTENSLDDLIVDIAVREGVNYFRGPEKDVALRFLNAGKQFGVKIFARVTADNPFTDPWLIKNMIHFQNIYQSDYVFCTTYPVGTRSELISLNALRDLYKLILDVNSTEYLTYYLKRKEFIVGCEYIPEEQYGTLRKRPSLTIDVPMDYIRITASDVATRDVTLSTFELISIYNGIGNLEFVDEGSSPRIVSDKYDCRLTVDVK